MEPEGACPVCGRPRTTTPTGAAVSCCPRFAPPAQSRDEAESLSLRLSARFDAWLADFGRARQASLLGHWHGCFTVLAALVLLAAVAVGLVFLGRAVWR